MQPASHVPNRDNLATDAAILLGFAQPSLDGLGALLDLVLAQTGVTLHSYRMPTLLRRVDGRLKKAGCRDYDHYLQLLLSDPGEARRLLEHVTIKLSRFFRNEGAFVLLRDMALPSLLASLLPNGELRVWSAGCGNGEEAYSLAIMLREAKVGQARSLPAVVFGTDVDESALVAARAGLYPKDAMSETPADLADRYFTFRPDHPRLHYKIHDEIRNRVSFLRHDLLSGIPVLDRRLFHLVLCRNVLIYFDRIAQARAFDLLTGSVEPGGYLCLGEAEQLPASHEHLFETVDRRNRLYRRRVISPQL